MWIWRLPMSPQTLPQPSAIVIIASRIVAPERDQLRKNWIRYASRSAGSSRSGSAGRVTTTSITSTIDSLVLIASSTIARATPITG